jgi:peptidoglycan/xylan/chitin deacetylase (PgdA/CDA1 family)
MVVLSADFEMAWAFQYSKTLAVQAVEQGLLERNNVPVILDLLDRHNIPVTWATVGHLFLESCSRSNGDIHMDMPRPSHFENRNWSFLQGKWYQFDPGTNYQQDPAWYAPDLVNQILSANTGHEIGCHTFSHIDFSDKNCPGDLAEAEIRKCKELAKKRNITLHSMVFPGGTEGNRSVLMENDFWGYRKPMKYDIDMPYIDENGLVAIPSSYGMDKPPYNWSENTCFEIAKAFVDKAVTSKKVCHLWFHPSVHPWYLERVFPRILEYIDSKRTEGDIEVNTMEKLASRVRK